MFKKGVVLFLIMTSLLFPAAVFAGPGERHGFSGGHPGPSPRGGYPGDFHPGNVVHRLPPGYISLLAGGLAYLFCEGLFYQYTPAGYIVVQPPMGAVIPALPSGYTTVFVNGIPYYYYGYTYYTPAPNGYTVVTPPATIMSPPAMPVTTTAPVTATATPQPAPVNVSNVAAKAEEKPKDVFEIYIPNGNGSYTVVALRKTEKGFFGPQGEFYADHPTVDQLKEKYAKKT